MVADGAGEGVEHILPTTVLPPDDQATLKTISDQAFDDRVTAQTALDSLHDIIHSLVPDQEKEKKEGGSGGLSALCLSGGGIRSASFCLGVMQALAEKRLLTNSTTSRPFPAAAISVLAFGLDQSR